MSTPQASNLQSDPIASGTVPAGHPAAAAGQSCPMLGSFCGSHASCPIFQLVTWQDPAKTGKVFGGILLVLLSIKLGNPINWFFHIAYIGLILAAVAEYAGKIITGQGLVSKYKPAPHRALAGKLKQDVLPQLADSFAKAEEKFLRIVFAQDFECTLKAAGMLFLLYKITSWFSVFTLVMVSFIAVFTLPAIYLRNEKEINAFVAQNTKLIKEKTCEATKDIRKQVQPHLDALLQKSGPVGNFFQLKFPTRTAGSTVGDSKATSYGTAADHIPATSTTQYGSSTPAARDLSSGASASTTGASKFPNIPKTDLSQTTYEDDLDQLAKDIHAAP